MASIEDLSVKRDATKLGLQTTGIRDPVLVATTLDAVPNLKETMAFTSMRNATTILKGPFKNTAMPLARPGVSTGSALYRRNISRFNPRSFGRLNYLERLDPNLGNRSFGGFGANRRVLSVNRLDRASPKFKSPAGFEKSRAGRLRSASFLQMGRATNYGLSKYLSTKVGSRGFLARQLPEMVSSPSLNIMRRPGSPVAPLINAGSTAARSSKSIPFASGGFIGNMFAADRVGRMRGTLGLSRATNITNYLKISNPNMVAALGGRQRAVLNLANMESRSASQIMHMSGQGVYNQFLGGMMAVGRSPITDTAASAAVKASRYAGVALPEQGGLAAKFLATSAGKGAMFQAEGLAYGGFTMGERIGARGLVGGMRAAYTGEGVMRAAGKYAAKRGALGTVAKDIADRAIVRGTTRVLASNVGQKVATMAGTKMAARFALAAGINAVPIAGQVASAVMLAWMAYDIAKLGGTLIGAGIKGTVDMAGQAVRSIEGSINKAPMSGFTGFGFQDTEASATSRQRGVQAIQNSRLNARSVLGSEAGMMYSHFG